MMSVNSSKSFFWLWLKLIFITIQRSCVMDKIRHGIRVLIERQFFFFFSEWQVMKCVFTNKTDFLSNTILFSSLSRYTVLDWIFPFLHFCTNKSSLVIERFLLHWTLMKFLSRSFSFPPSHRLWSHSCRRLCVFWSFFRDDILMTKTSFLLLLTDS